MALHSRQPLDVRLQVWRGPPAAAHGNPESSSGLHALTNMHSCTVKQKQPLLFLIFCKTEASRGLGSVTAHAYHPAALPLGAPQGPCRPACSASPCSASCQWPPFSEHPELWALGSAARLFKLLLAHPALTAARGSLHDLHLPGSLANEGQSGESDLGLKLQTHALFYCGI